MLVLAFQFLIPAVRTSTWGLMRVGMEQEAIGSLARLCGDLQKTEATGVTVCYTPPFVASNPYQQNSDVLNTAGEVVWTNEFRITYFDDSADELRWRTWPCSPPGSADPASLANNDRAAKKIPLALVPDLVKDRKVCRIMARDVKEFRIEPAGCDVLLKQPLKFTIVIERSGNTGRAKAEQFSFSRTVFLAGTR